MKRGLSFELHHIAEHAGAPNRQAGCSASPPAVRRSQSDRELQRLDLERENFLTTMDARISRAQMQAGSARRYDASVSKVSGFLIDLDGTMYQPGSLLPGAIEFYDWLVGTGKPFVFLSNTGAKGSEGVQKKLGSAQYKLSTPVPLRHAYTAAEAQLEYLSDTLKPGAKVFSLAGGSFWLSMLRMKKPLLFDSLDIRTKLSDAEAKAWCVEAKATSGSATEARVHVVFFVDGEIGSTVDPTTGEAGVTDWSYDVIKQTAWLLSAGAEYIYTADDAFNPSVDAAHPGMVFPLPGPGMFAAMMRKVMYPETKDNFACCGKGGVVGKQYMMEHAIEMLKLQGHSGDRSTIMMIGDRFDTDIRAGASVGIRTCLVESGCHSLKLQPDFPRDRADFYAANVGHLVPGTVVQASTAGSAVPSTISEATSEVFECREPSVSPPPPAVQPEEVKQARVEMPVWLAQADQPAMATLAPGKYTAAGPPMFVPTASAIGK